MKTFEQINSTIEKYLIGALSGAELIKFIDDLVSDDDVYGYSIDLQDLILRFQDLFALYVEDPNRRTEHPDYYGPKNLKLLVNELKSEMERVARLPKV